MNACRIVDAHMHLGCPQGLFTHSWETREILRFMDRLGIDRAYSMHHYWLAGRYAEGREESVRAYAESGGRIPFIAVHNPMEERESMETMDACLGHPGFIGIKLHPSFHGLPADDDRYESVWRYASAHGLPIVSHTWSTTYNPVQKLSLPRLFRRWVAEYGDVKFVCGHAGGPGDGQAQAVQLAAEHSNVYMDMSGDTFSYGLIPHLVKSVGADRLLFGTDQPWIDPRCHLTRIYLADIGEEARRLILRETALRLFEPSLSPYEHNH